MNLKKSSIINLNVSDKELIERSKTFKIRWKAILKWCKALANLVGKLATGSIFGSPKNGLIMINGEKINFSTGSKWGKYSTTFKSLKNTLGEKSKGRILSDWDV